MKKKMKREMKIGKERRDDNEEGRNEERRRMKSSIKKTPERKY